MVDVADQLAELTWTAPTPPDDPTITGYTITASPADTPPVALDQATDILWFYLGHHAWRLLAAASAPVGRPDDCGPHAITREAGRPGR